MDKTGVQICYCICKIYHKKLQISTANICPFAFILHQFPFDKANPAMGKYQYCRQYLDLNLSRILAIPFQVIEGEKQDVIAGLMEFCAVRV